MSSTTNETVQAHDPIQVEAFLQGARLFSSTMLEVIEEGILAEIHPRHLGRSGFKVLRLLEGREIGRVGDVVRRLEVSYPTASKIVDRLVKNGLVVRCEDPTDRRASRLELAPPGVELIARYEAAMRDATRHLLADIPPEALPQLGPLLQGLAVRLMELVRMRASSAVRYSSLALFIAFNLDGGLGWTGWDEWAFEPPPA